MAAFDIHFIDATDWQVLPWFSSGGTRAKRVLQDDEGKLWYFKCSERKEAKNGKPEKYYKYEFWSEILAYQLGHSLGLDILRYDPALHNGEIGCISPLMIDQDKEQLVELGRYMAVLNPDFNPDDRKTHSEYTFDFLIETLEYFDQNQYLDLFLKTMVFDALIGNTDRHQENWAFIARSTFVNSAIELVKKQAREKGFKKLSKIIRILYGYLFDKEKNELNQDGRILQLRSQNVIKMAPIYDSGSSLGRELSEERIGDYINNQDKLLNYVNNGKSEIHWAKSKISHFEIIGNLLTSAYLEQLIGAASFLKNFSEQNVSQLVVSLDNMLPDGYFDYCLTDKRKEFIIKLLSLRAQKLNEVFNDGRV